MNLRPIALALLLPLAAVGCGDDSSSGTSPEPTPTVIDRIDAQGALVAADGGWTLDADDGSEYYEGMRIDLDGVLLLDGRGNRITADDLSKGLAVGLQIDEGCAESLPVQCQVSTLTLFAE